jgi:hypothetical protein
MKDAISLRHSYAQERSLLRFPLHTECNAHYGYYGNSDRSPQANCTPFLNKSATLPERLKILWKDLLQSSLLQAIPYASGTRHFGAE